ncbi:MAG: peptidase M13, partial [Marmoricola sp.]
MTILDDAREGMDLSVRPQDDLFGHVNGTWLTESEIPADRASWGPFVMLADVCEQQVREIIEDCSAGGPAGSTSASSADAKKIGDLFASFMDEARVEELGASPIEATLASIENVHSLLDLAAFLGDYERAGGGGVFGSYIDSDDRDSDRYLVNITQGGIGLPDESYYREDKFEEIRTKYVDYLETILTLAGRPTPRETAETVFALEKRIAEGHWERAETRDVIKSYNLTPVAELKATLPSFDFDVYIGNLGGNAQTLTESVVRQPSFLEHLETVLKETPIKVWRSYLEVKVVRSSAAYLSDAFVQANFDFYGRTLSGTPELRA